MTDNRVEANVLLLSGDAGELYAIPQEALEKYRVKEEQRAELEQQLGDLGDDVSGYKMELYNTYLVHKAMANHYGEENLRRADYDRIADDAEVAQAPDDDASATRPQGLRRAFTGLLVTLHLAPTARLKES